MRYPVGSRGGLLVRSVRYRTFWQFPHQIALFGNSRTKSNFLAIYASNRTFSHNNVRGIDANRQKTASIRLRAAEGHNFATAEFFQNPQNPFKIPTSSQSRVTHVSRDPLCQSRTGSVITWLTCTGAAWPAPTRDVTWSFQNPHETRECLELESDHFLQLAPLLRINSYSGCIFDFGYLLIWLMDRFLTAQSLILTTLLPHICKFWPHFCRTFPNFYRTFTAHFGIIGKCDIALFGKKNRTKSPPL